MSGGMEELEIDVRCMDGVGKYSQLNSIRYHRTRHELHPSRFATIFGEVTELSGRNWKMVLGTRTYWFEFRVI